MTIIKSCIAAALFVLLWAWILTILPEGIDTSQHQFNKNLITGERYLYSDQDFSDKNVILGSSLVARIELDSLPKNFINLSFSGLGVFDGLSLVNHRKEKPKAIFIEMNIILKEEHEAFQSALFSPIFNKINNVLPLFQVKNQPVGVVKGIIKGDSKIAPNWNKSLDADLFEFVKRQYLKKPDKELLDKTFLKLKENILSFEKDGGVVIFFEMPIHEELCISEYFTSLRKRFIEEFPIDQYCYIKQPTCKSYQTTDGIHLTASSIHDYTQYFKKAIKKCSDTIPSNTN